MRSWRSMATRGSIFNSSDVESARLASRKLARAAPSPQKGNAAAILELARYVVTRPDRRGVAAMLRSVASARSKMPLFQTSNSLTIANSATRSRWRFRKRQNRTLRKTLNT
jgi:hypothetical protein